MPTDELATEIDKAVEEIVVENKEIATKEDVTQEAAATEQTVKETDDKKEATEVESEKVTEEKSGKEEITETETTEASKLPVISDEALTRAVQVGIPLETARQFPNEQSLNSISANLERQSEEFNAAAYNPPPEQKEEVKDPFADLPKLDPEVYEPEVVQFIERLTDIVKEQDKTVKQQSEEIQSFRAQQEASQAAQMEVVAQEVEQWFNKQVSNLGEDFSDALGVGDYRSLSQGSSQLAKREAIADQMSVLLSGYDAMGQQAPSREQVFNTAARLVLQDEFQAIHEKKLSKDLESRASQHIQRAGGQKATGKQTPQEEAAAELDAKYFSK